MVRLTTFFLLLSLSAAPVSAGVPVTLKGSPASISRQHSVAKEAGLDFASTAAELRAMEEAGELVAIRGNADFTVSRGVSSPRAVAEMRLFLERLAAQYHEATGEKLVVTSLTRARSRQPRNAHRLSVHPTGIAVDFRVSRQAKSRQWLESALLALERKGLLDVTRERRPPHYHVALFPAAYRAHVEQMIGAEALAAALNPVEPPQPEPVAARIAPLPPPATAATVVPVEHGVSVPGAPAELALLPLLVLAARLLRRRLGRSPNLPRPADGAGDSPF